MEGIRQLPASVQSSAVVRHKRPQRLQDGKEGYLIIDLFKKNAEADSILLGSPIYSADVPSTLKAVIECASVISDSNPGMFRHKVCGTVAIAGRGRAMNVIDTLHHFLLNKKISGRLYLLGHHLRPFARRSPKRRGCC